MSLLLLLWCSCRSSYCCRNGSNDDHREKEFCSLPNVVVGGVVVVVVVVVVVIVVVIVVVDNVGKETHTWYSTRSGSGDDYREKELCSQPYAPLSQIPSPSDQP